MGPISISIGGGALSDLSTEISGSGQFNKMFLPSFLLYHIFAYYLTICIFDVSAGGIYFATKSCDVV